MRDPARLDKFYKELLRIHKTYCPDWRFMQFISNFVCWYGNDPFYMEEQKVLEKLKEYCKVTFKNFEE